MLIILLGISSTADASLLYGLTSASDVKAYDVTTGNNVNSFATDFFSSGSMAFAPDGTLYGLTSAGNISGYDVTTGLNVNSFSANLLAVGQ